MPKAKNDYPHSHPDVPTDWQNPMQIDRGYSGGVADLMKRCLPCVKLALLQGMVEGGLSEKEAGLVLDQKYIKTKPDNPQSNILHRQYLSPATLDLMEQAGVLKRRWKDRIKQETTDSQEISTR